MTDTLPAPTPGKLPAGWRKEHNGEKGRHSKWTVSHEDGRSFTVQSKADIDAVIAVLEAPTVAPEADASEDIDETDED